MVQANPSPHRSQMTTLFLMGARFTTSHSGQQRLTQIDLRTAMCRSALFFGLILLNWWLLLPFLGGWPNSLNGLMSDATATGSPDAQAIRVVEFLACGLLLAALFLRGPIDQNGKVRRDWWCTVALVMFEAFDALFVEACRSGTDHQCFKDEMSFSLPPHHYLHVAGGVLEWSFALAAVILGLRRLRSIHSPLQHPYRSLLIFAIAVIAPLAAAFITHRLFVVVESTVYVAFSLLIYLQVAEPSLPTKEREIFNTLF